MSWVAIYLLVGVIFTGWFRLAYGKTRVFELLLMPFIWLIVAMLFFLEWAGHTEI